MNKDIENITPNYLYLTLYGMYLHERSKPVGHRIRNRKGMYFENLMKDMATRYSLNEEEQQFYFDEKIR